MKTFKEIKQKLLSGNTVELDDVNGNMIELFLGHNNRFCLMLNTKVILSVVMWKTIENKLKTIEGLCTVENQMDVL